jgi:hypothetical protein
MIPTGCGLPDTQMSNMTAGVRLPSVSPNEPVAATARSAIAAIVDKNLAPPAALLTSFEREFMSLVAMTVSIIT